MAKLGEILVEAGVLTPEQLETALAAASRDSHRLLGQVLLELGFVEAHHITGAIAQQVGMAMVESGEFEADADAVAILGQAFCRKAQLLPLRTSDGGRVLGMADPMNLVWLDQARQKLGSNWTPAVMLAGDFQNALTAIAGPRDTAATIAQQLGFAGEVEFEESALVRQPANDGPDGSDAAPTVRMVGAVIGDAIAARASDIHIEPREESTQVRYRVDGRLRHVLTLPTSAHASLIARVKVMADMDITERRAPQDGRLRVHYAGRRVDVRVSTLPTTHGEKGVLRILDRASGIETLQGAGFGPEARALIEDILSRPQGCLLCTGPTGSGKTSTLYACLNYVMSEDTNTVTIEDPVERHIPGASQVQIADAAGLSFAGALRAVLRQDPDIVMVGEIRDRETAEIAMRASMTGHLVLSSIHTNDALTTVTRLIDMGVEAHLVASALSLALAQRLVRHICPMCRTEWEPTEEVASRAMRVLGAVPEGPFFVGVGCPDCAGTGYAGRTVVYETLPVTGQMERLVAGRAGMAELVAAARETGVKPMFACALTKVRQGITTLGEVLRQIPPPAEAWHESTCGLDVVPVQ